MNLSRLAILTTLAALWCWQAPLVQESDPVPQEETVSFNFGPVGLSFEDFVKLLHEHLGRPITYDENRINSQLKRIKFAGEAKVPKAEVGRFLQDLLVAHGMVLHAIGTRENCLLLIEPVDGRATRTQEGTALPFSEIESCAKNPARLYSVIIPLKFIALEDASRVVKKLLAGHPFGFSMPLPAVNCLLVSGQGGMISTVNQLLQMVDQDRDQLREAQPIDDGGEEKLK